MGDASQQTAAAYRSAFIMLPGGSAPPLRPSAARHLAVVFLDGFGSLDETDAIHLTSKRPRRQSPREIGLQPRPVPPSLCQPPSAAAADVDFQSPR